MQKFENIFNDENGKINYTLSNSIVYEEYYLNRKLSVLNLTFPLNLSYFVLCSVIQYTLVL